MTAAKGSSGGGGNDGDVQQQRSPADQQQSKTSSKRQRRQQQQAATQQEATEQPRQQATAQQTAAAAPQQQAQLAQQPGQQTGQYLYERKYGLPVVRKKLSYSELLRAVRLGEVQEVHFFTTHEDSTMVRAECPAEACLLVLCATAL